MRLTPLKQFLADFDSKQQRMLERQQGPPWAALESPSPVLVCHRVRSTRRTGSNHRMMYECHPSPTPAQLTGHGEDDAALATQCLSSGPAFAAYMCRITAALAHLFITSVRRQVMHRRSPMEERALPCCLKIARRAHMHLKSAMPPRGPR